MLALNDQLRVSSPYMRFPFLAFDVRFHNIFQNLDLKIEYFI